MSEYVGEARVRIIPDARDFGTELKRQVGASTSRGLGNDWLARQQAEIRKTGAEARSYNRQLGELEKRQQGMSRTTAGSIATFTTLGIVTRSLVSDFGKWAQTQGDVAQGLGKIATGISNLDVVTAGRGLGELAGTTTLGINDVRAAAEAAQREKRYTEQQRLNQLASDFLDLRERASKAEGQVGTAAGRVKYQLERQLEVARQQLKLADPQQRRIAFGQLGTGDFGATNQRLAARNPVATGPTDADYNLKLLRAQITKTQTDDLALFRDRAKFLKGLIGHIEESGADTAKSKANLARLYGQLLSTQSQITGIEEQVAAARAAALQKSIALNQTNLQIAEVEARTTSQKIAALSAERDNAAKLAQDTRLDAQERANYALQAAQYNSSILDIQDQIRETNRQKAEEEKRIADDEKKANQEKLARQKDAYRQLRELRLSNAEAKAQLTQSTADDKKAIRASIAYWKSQVKELTGLAREQARSELISAKSRLKGVGSSGSGASVADFYREVLSDFRQYGSNFSTQSGGVLSPQAARGQFAALAIGNTSSKQLELAQKQEQARLQRTQTNEAIKQTKYLGQIAGALTGTGGGVAGGKGTSSKVPSVATSVAYGLGGAYINGS